MARTPDKALKAQEEKALRDRLNKEFAGRLAIAVSNHPAAPKGRGMQNWLHHRLVQNHDKDLTRAAVSKWFLGKTRPMHPTMVAIAETTNADFAWLSEGGAPEYSPDEKRQSGKVASGAVHVVAGLIQINGGHVIFPDGESSVDFYALIDGEQYGVIVRTGSTDGGEATLNIPQGSDRRLVLAVVSTSPMTVDVLHVPADLIARSGAPKGGHVELAVSIRRDRYTVGKEVLKPLRSFQGLRP